MANLNILGQQIEVADFYNRKQDASNAVLRFLARAMGNSADLKCNSGNATYPIDSPIHLISRGRHEDARKILLIKLRAAHATGVDDGNRSDFRAKLQRWINVLSQPNALRPFEENYRQCQIKLTSYQELTSEKYANILRNKTNPQRGFTEDGDSFLFNFHGNSFQIANQDGSPKIAADGSLGVPSNFNSFCYPNFAKELTRTPPLTYRELLVRTQDQIQLAIHSTLVQAQEKSQEQALFILNPPGAFIRGLNETQKEAVKEIIKQAYKDAITWARDREYQIPIQFMAHEHSIIPDGCGVTQSSGDLLSIAEECEKAGIAFQVPIMGEPKGAVGNGATSKGANSALDEFYARACGLLHAHKAKQVFQEKITELDQSQPKIVPFLTHEQKIAQNIITQQRAWLQSADGIRIFKKNPMNPNEILKHTVGFDWWIFPSSTQNTNHQEFNVTFPFQSRGIDKPKLQSRNKIYQIFANDQGFMDNYYHCLDRYLTCAIANRQIKPFDARIGKVFESMIGIGLNKIQRERQDIFKKAQRVFEANAAAIQRNVIDPEGQVLGFVSQLSRAEDPQPRPGASTTNLTTTQVSVTEKLTNAIEAYLQADQASPQPKTAIDTALDASLDSQNNIAKPTQAYRGCGIKASFDEQNRFMIDEVFAARIDRFTVQKSGQTKILKNSRLTTDPKKEITAIWVDGQYKSPLQIIKDQITINPANEQAGIDAGLAIIAAAFHGKQETQFKVKIGESEVELSCAANNKDVFVTKDCQSARSNIVGKTGDKYNPRTHGTPAIDPQNKALEIVKVSQRSTAPRK